MLLLGILLDITNGIYGNISSFPSSTQEEKHGLSLVEADTGSFTLLLNLELKL